MFKELKKNEEQSINGGSPTLYAWGIAAGIVGVAFVLDKSYTCGKHAGEALYYYIYE